MGKCVFSDAWLEKDEYREWLKRDADKYQAYCKVCYKTFKLGTMGVKALDSHMSSEKHKSIMERRRSCHTLTNFVVSASSNTTESRNGASRGESSSASGSTSSGATNSADIREVFGSTDTLKSEVLWVMNTAYRHNSFSSNKKVGQLFAKMFPDSKIAKNFTCGENKTSYMVKSGLAPYVRAQLVKSLGDDNYVLSFNESLNQTTRNKQLDLQRKERLTEEKGRKRKQLQDDLEGLRKKQKTVTEVCEKLFADADMYAERAEAAGGSKMVELISKSNAFRKKSQRQAGKLKTC